MSARRIAGLVVGGLFAAATAALLAAMAVIATGRPGCGEAGDRRAANRESRGERG